MPIKDDSRRREYQRNYARLRRAGLTGSQSKKRSQSVKPALIEDDTLRLETVKDYMDVINRVIMDVRDDADSSRIQKARTVGYLVNIALKALELGSIEERVEQLEATINTAAWR
ncbi:MAG: hypothetical protein ACXV3D_02740 [Halobacteriota archaeon]